MKDNKSTEELIKLDDKKILDLIKQENNGSYHETHEANMQYLTGILNYKLSKTTESLSKKIFWLNIILVILTLVLTAETIYKMYGHFSC